MDSSTRERRIYSDALISRLRRSYVEQRIPPTHDTPINFAMLRRLCQHILAEGYNELPADPNSTR